MEPNIEWVLTRIGAKAHAAPPMSAANARRLARDGPRIRPQGPASRPWFDQALNESKDRTMSIEIPACRTLGESVTEATVATWFKKPGDTVSVDEMLCELETDKVTVEVPSPASGTLGEDRRR